MKEIKLYNVIFPIWIILFLPPVILFTLAGNFVIDSLVVIGCFYAFKLRNYQFDLKSFYKKNILKVWIFGFIADFIGAIILFLTLTVVDNTFDIPYEVTNAISYNPFSNVAGFLTVVFAMLVSCLFIYLFNYYRTFKYIKEVKLRFKLALTIAIITIPWTFLIPYKWLN
ncbi:hypothetical protein [Abyssisolibacter fermentans]|uniref:hypothetical protein n=1 Tax=Abyssisolibacter fermentans TaxID=1766203 RepID=UPI000832CE82|nr:hypothetical protein [Abyssisolibacter fermentans]